MTLIASNMNCKLADGGISIYYNVHLLLPSMSDVSVLNDLGIMQQCRLA